MLQRLAGELNDEQAKQLRMISSSGKHLLELVNHVLDLAKVEAGETRVHLAPVDIPADELARVFEEFYQVERPDVAKSEGTGLGLSVSRRLVEVLGGSIEASIEVGEGSTFTVILPARPFSDDQG